MAKPLVITIDAQDLISGKINKISLKMTDSIDKIEKKQKSAFSNIASSISKYNLVLTGVVTAAGAAAIKFVNMASAAEEVHNKFDVVFRSVDNATGVIKNMSEETGYAESSLQGMMSSLGDLIKPAGFAADKAFDLSRQITQLSLDLGSFNDMRPQDVVKDFQSALAGSVETLQKYGIDARDMALAQQAFNMGLIDSIKAYEGLDPAQKRQVRTQALIAKAFADSKDAIGDLARTQDSYANQSKQLAEATKELGEMLGELLIPAFTEVVSAIRDGTKWITDFIDSITKSDIEKQIEQMQEYGAAVNDINNAIQQKTLFELGKELIENEEKLADATQKLNEYYKDHGLALRVLNMDYETYNKLSEESSRLKNDIAKTSVNEFNNLMAQHNANVKVSESTRDYTKAMKERKQIIDELLESFDKYVDTQDEIENIKEPLLNTTNKILETSNKINDSEKSFVISLKHANIEQETYRASSELTETQWKWIAEHGQNALDAAKQMPDTMKELKEPMAENVKYSEDMADNFVKSLYALADIIELSKKKKIKFSQLLALGGTIATAVGHPEVGEILEGAAAVSRAAGYQYGGEGIFPGSGLGDRPYVINAAPGERFQVIPKNETTYNNYSNPTINLNIHTNYVDEIFVRNKLMPVLRDLVTRNRVPLYATEIR